MFSQQMIEAEHVLTKFEECKYIINDSQPIDCLVQTTNFKLCILVKSRINGSSETASWLLKGIPLCTMQSLKIKYSRIGSKSIGIVIPCKDMRIVKLIFSDANQGVPLFHQLKDLVSPNVCKRPLFAYLFGKQCQEINKNIVDGWDVFDPILEYHRQNIENNGWRVSNINEDYSFCKTYPSLLAVPMDVTDELLAQSSRHRDESRVCVLSWLHPESRASLTRASQPMVGVQGLRNTYDEQVVERIRKANANSSNLLIFDARPQRFAVANKGHGGGIETPMCYQEVACKFMNIQNIHSMRASLTKLFEAVCHLHAERCNWWTMLHESGWLHHLRLIILAARDAADQIENHKRSILVHCSDGCDRTTQITSLAMLMLDPYYRTLRGFQVLIEKEWVSFGHKFSKRTGGPSDGLPIALPTSPPMGIHRSGSDERSPVFLQFVDCVWQITQQFPGAFEFNEHLLITIMDELYAGRCGTFLFDSERESRNHQARQRTVSLWALINSNVSPYLNPTYTPAEISGHRVILPNPDLSNLRFWNGYFLRWEVTLQCQEPVTEQTAVFHKNIEQFRKALKRLSAPQRKPLSTVSRTSEFTIDHQSAAKDIPETKSCFPRFPVGASARVQ